MGLIFISTCFSSDKKSSILGANTRYEGMLMFASYIIIYISAKKFFKYDNYKLFLNIMFYTSMVIGILGIIQNYYSNIRFFPIFGAGISGTFGNSNFFGSYISIVLPISIAIFIINSNNKSFILSLILFFDMISSGTRSAWVAFVAVALFGFIYLIAKKNKIFWKRTGILLFCFALICLYLFSGISHSVTKAKFSSIKNDIVTFSKQGLSNNLGSSRMEIWKMSLKLMAKKPLFGCGTDNLVNGLIKNCQDDLVKFATRTKTIPDKAHNEYLHIGVTLGVPALIIYLVFIGMILLPKTKYMFKNNLIFIFCLTIISYLVQAFFNISTIGVAPLFWMLLGLSDNKDILNNLKEKI